MDFISHINSFVNIDPDITFKLLSVIQFEECPKGQILHKEGKICEKIFFVQKGLTRLFYQKKDKDVTAWFAPENYMITAVDSFFQRKPSVYSIEVIENSSLFSITHTDLENLFSQHPQLERVGRLMAYETLAQLAERVYAIQFHTALERYQLMLKKHPDILQRAPLGHIASYLGIEQETLSRIRGKSVVTR